jgi:hypothetical protein
MFSASSGVARGLEFVGMDADPPLNPTCPGCAAAAGRIADLERRNAELGRRLAALEAIVDELRRGGKRQAAPFSKGPPKPDPEPPGRKPGDGYGTRARRAVPPRIHETYEAPLPEACPACGGRRLDPVGAAEQYQAEVPRAVVYRRFDVRVGRCRDCGRRVQGRHPLQTSDALGAAASGLGPDAQWYAPRLMANRGFLQMIWARISNPAACRFPATSPANRPACQTYTTWPGNSLYASVQSTRSSLATVPVRFDSFSPSRCRQAGSYATPYGASVTIRNGTAPPSTLATSCGLVLSPQSSRWVPSTHRSPGRVTGLAGGSGTASGSVRPSSTVPASRTSSSASNPSTARSTSSAFSPASSTASRSSSHSAIYAV